MKVLDPHTPETIPTLENCVVCHECDLLVNISHLDEGSRADCPRCGCILSSAHRNAFDRILIFSISALLCLGMSAIFDFVQMAVAGQQRQITMPETIEVLFTLHDWTLAGFTALIIIGLPLVYMLSLIWLMLEIRLGLASLASFNLLRFIGFLRFWNMAEIFFLGILISMVKVADMAHISLGFSFWSYALFNLFMILALYHVDQYQIAHAIRQQLFARKINLAVMT